VLQVALVFVAVQLFTEKDEPVLFKLPAALLLLHDLALMVDGIFAFASLARVRTRHARKATNAILNLREVKSASDTGRHLLLGHVDVLV